MPAIVVQVIDRALQLLDFLAKQPGPAKLQTIARAVELHPSTAHRILNDLGAGGLVSVCGRGLYELGPRMAEMAASAQKARGPRYRLLDEGERLQADDEFIADDAEAWLNLGTHANWFVGLLFKPGVNQPTRRRLEVEEVQHA